MTFGSPWLLWGTLLGAIPIIVHLLNRRRYRETPWAAMRFLLEATRKNSRRIRIEQLVLLVVRTLILVLLAIALARPFVESTGLLGTTSEGVHRIVVVDASYSMAATRGDGTRFDDAVAVARSVVSGSRAGDALNLVLMHGHGPRTLVGEPSYRHEEVAAELERVTVSHAPGDLVGTLREVAAILEANPEPARKEVVFIGDLQRADWLPGRESARAELREAVESLGRDVPFTVVDVGDGSTGNVAVTGLALADPFVAVDVPVVFRVTLENHTAEGRGTQPVELHVDGRLRERKSVALPATGDAAIDFTVTFDDSGDHLVEVRIPSDALPLDDVRSLVVGVREAIEVLLVDGRPSGRFGESATSFLEVALVPDEGSGEGLLRRRTIGEGELLDVDLARYDAVFVCNVGLVTDRETEVLRRYVESGGGLVLALGDRVRVENWNRTLYRTEFTFDEVGLEPGERSGDGVQIEGVTPGSPAHRAGLRAGSIVRIVDGTEVDSADELRRAIEAGSLSNGITVEATTADGRGRTVRVRRPPLLPARLREIVRTEADGDGFGFDAADLSHPIVRAFDGNPEAGLLSTRILHYVAVDPETLGTARVALPLTTGDPLILEQRLGRGHVVLVTTSLDRTWGGTWPGRPSYPQLVREVTAFAVSGRDAGRDVLVGQPVIRTFATPVVGATANVERPDGRVVSVPLDDGGTSLAFDETDRAGAYELRLPAPNSRRERFAVNLDPAEGNLARVEPNVLDGVLASVRHRLRTEWVPGAADTASTPTGGPFTVWLLTAVGALLLVETVMAWRFALGLALLATLVAASLAARLLPWPFAVAVLLLAAVGGYVWSRRTT